MNKKRILWLSRHSPTNDQKLNLEKALNTSLDLIQVSTTVKSAYEVRKIMDREKCDDIVAVLPLTIIGQLCSIGIYPIRLVTSKKEINGETVIEYNTFVRVEKVEVVQLPLESEEVKK